MNETHEISRISLVFIIVAVAYTIIMFGTLGSIFSANQESATIRHLYFLKSAEAETFKKICLTACLEEVPKISDHLIQIKQGQEVVDATTETETKTKQ
jgi:hypothetical protein